MSFKTVLTSECVPCDDNGAHPAAAAMPWETFHSSYHCLTTGTGCPPEDALKKQPEGGP